MNSARCDSVAGVSAQASRVTNGRRRCRSASDAWSFSCMASLQIGREKQSGMSSTPLTGWYANPAATIAASLTQVPPFNDPLSSVVLGRRHAWLARVKLLGHADVILQEHNGVDG